jgi:cell division protein FtsI (penicillin-binding protein 3)
MPSCATPRTKAPAQLSLDLSVQAVVEQVLDGGMRLMNAKGATAILMDIHTGEIISMASLPDFDPNDRPPLPTSGDPSDSPLFNRAVQGVYELGSTFKIFPVAQAIELGSSTLHHDRHARGRCAGAASGSAISATTAPS